jgi:hypothetical protein
VPRSISSRFTAAANDFCFLENREGLVAFHKKSGIGVMMSDLGLSSIAKQHRKLARGAGFDRAALHDLA